MHAAGISQSLVPHPLHDERKACKRTSHRKDSHISNSAYHLTPALYAKFDSKCQLFAPNYLNFSFYFSSFAEISKIDLYCGFEQFVQKVYWYQGGYFRRNLVFIFVRLCSLPLPNSLKLVQINSFNSVNNILIVYVQQLEMVLKP